MGRLAGQDPVLECGLACGSGYKAAPQSSQPHSGLLKLPL